MSQLHKRFTSGQVKELLERYLKNEVERNIYSGDLGDLQKAIFYAP